MDLPPTDSAPGSSPSVGSRPVLILLVMLATIFAGRLAHTHYTLRPSEQRLAVSRQIDLNQADATQLAQISGLGPQRAQAIVEHRTLYGGFDSPGELTRVRGIGPAISAKVLQHASLDDSVREPEQLVRKPTVSSPPPYAASLVKKIQSGEPLININHASEAEMQRLPGIGPTLARRLIESRELGPFTTPDDLLRVKGIGSKTLERLRPFIICK